MAQKAYGSLILATPSITASQGDFTSVNDNPQQQYPTGCIWVFPDSTGCPRIIKYVQYNPTSAATWTQGAPLYYKDYTRTIVTNTVTEAATYAASSGSALFSFAGIGLNNATTAPPTVGNWIWIQIGGYCNTINCPASTVAGDLLVLSNSTTGVPTNNTFIRIAAATDLTLNKTSMSMVILTAIGPSGGGLGTGWVRTPCFIL